MKVFTSIIFILVLQFLGFSQTLTNSNLPIVIITTDTNPNTGNPYDIPDDYKVPGSMKIVYHIDGSRNYVTDQNNQTLLNYNGRISIETRGSTSQDVDKKPYNFKTIKIDNSNNNVSILGMPKEHDWALQSMSFDASLIRDCLSYELARRMGNYAPRTRYCEVILNGEYRGVYMIVEKIKIDENRVDIEKMNSSDIEYPQITGGYITKADKTTGGDPIAWNMDSYDYYYKEVNYIHHSPKPDSITQEQNDYIQSQFEKLELELKYFNTSFEDGYPSIIDVPSFIDYMLISEITSNVDSYQYSTFFHKDRNGKLRAGPVWDYNLTYGNDLSFWGLDRSHTDVWQFDNGDNTGSQFWKDLYDEGSYNCYLTKRWKELNASNNVLYYNKITSIIDSLTVLLSEAINREEQKWGTIGNYTQQIFTMKNWISERINWINSQLNDFTACSSPYIPKLVISKIHYYPQALSDNVSKSLEFIAISNAESTTIDLSGLYFKDLCITYQFPFNSHIDAGKTIYLAGNAQQFELQYGFEPFGEFRRNLSNKSEKIELVDGFGNTIDKVMYLDTLPWPMQANGRGAYLQLKNVYLDNSIASSWIASNYALEISKIQKEETISINPSPVTNFITIIGGSSLINSYTIYDLFGRKIMQIQHPNSNIISVSSLPSNLYILEVAYVNGSIIRKKFIKIDN